VPGVVVAIGVRGLVNPRGAQELHHGGARPPEVVTVTDGVRPPDGPTSAAMVQLLRSARVHDPAHTYCDHDPGHEHAADVGVYFDAGRLAVRWHEQDVGSRTHEILWQQARTIRAALIATTRPAHVTDQSGKQLTGHRIGPTARGMVEATGLMLGRGGPQRFRLG